jgi:pimeloyl-ACP methyl ester carboxylesterase
MPYLTVQGVSAHFVQRRPVPAGQPVVVFIHGAGGSHQHWLYQVRDLLSASTTAVDLPGHGRSEGAGRDSIESYGDWIVAFLDESRVERAVLVGHSMGGAIALDVALRYPFCVAGLGLVASGARLRVAPAILEVIRTEPEAAVALIGDWAYGPKASPDLVRLGRRQMSATPPEVLYGDFLACDGFNVIGRLGEIEVPAHVMCGTQDRLTPPKYATYLRDHISGATLSMIDGAGHMVMIEDPVAVVKALASLLGEIQAAG